MEDINPQKYIGRFINEWRGRTVQIYEHEDPTKVVTVGTPLTGGTPIICIENRSDYTATLQRIKDAEDNGKIYVFK